MRLQSADERIEVCEELGRDDVRVQLQGGVIASIALCVAIISVC